MESAQEIRNRIRAARQVVSTSDRIQGSNMICRRVAKTDWFQAANKVAGFLAFDGEADPIGLMTEAVNLDKQVFVPIIVAKSKPLKFARWSPTTKLKQNRFGIPEPDVPPSQWIEARDLDFVITPLVAFDEKCNRIGVGGGFYDRSFAFLNNPNDEATTPKVHLIGFAFEMQKVDLIESQKWDVRLDGVATETGMHVH